MAKQRKSRVKFKLFGIGVSIVRIALTLLSYVLILHLILLLSTLLNIILSHNIMKQENSAPMNAFKDPALVDANKHFMAKQFETAIPLYQKYIQDRVELIVEIDGLANNEISIGYYEWFIPDWYQRNVEEGNYNGTAYDLLSLSYLSSNTKEELMENGIKWYRTMIGSNNH